MKDVYALSDEKFTATESQNLETELELTRLMQNMGEMQQALEQLSIIYLNVYDNKNIDLKLAKQQTDSILYNVGLEELSNKVSLEDYGCMSREVALEDLLQTIKNGMSRIFNFYSVIGNFIDDKVMYGLKTIKQLVTNISGDVEKAREYAERLKPSSKDIYVNKDIQRYLQTKNGKPLDGKHVSEILQNHIDLLKDINSYDGFIKILSGKDLDKFRELMSDVSDGTKRKYPDNLDKKIVEDMRKIFDHFKHYHGKPLADGMTPFIEFDDAAANNPILYKDFFQIDIVKNANYKRPLEAKSITSSEGKKIVSQIQELLKLYKDTEDWSHHVRFIRQKLLTLDVYSWANAIITPIGLNILVAIGLAIGSLIYTVLWLFKVFGYTSSSLSYYAVRESCQYLKISATHSLR